MKDELRADLRSTVEAAFLAVNELARIEQRMAVLDPADHGALPLAVQAEELAETLRDVTRIARHLVEVAREHRGDSRGTSSGRRSDPGDQAKSGLQPAIETLTPAELRVVRYLPTHLRAKEIATALGVSPHTTKSQIFSIYRKLGASNRREAVATAIDRGLLPPPLDRSTS
jgi:DNA-binding NarL/FixJ family response regulator